MTMNSVFKKLRKHNKQNYRQILFCITFSVTLITSFAVTLYSPTIQNTLPVGGDTRTRVYMIFAIALIGCLFFIFYTTGLFLKYKSKEMGILLALGAKKKQLSKTLFIEIVLIVAVCFVVGLALGGILSFIIWQIFGMLFDDSTWNTYYFALTGYIIGFAYVIVIALCIIIMAMRYMKKTNIIEIMNEERKSEPIRLKVDRKYGMIGLVLLFSGITLGYIVPNAVVNLFNFSMPDIWNVTYLLSVAGMYMVLVFAVVYNKKGKNLKKYYKNIVPYSMMKFQGQQTVRNMAILCLLIFGSLYACSYLTEGASGAAYYQESPIDFALPFRVDAKGISKEEIFSMAEKHQVAITEYVELVFTELIGNRIERDWDSSGKAVEKYVEMYKYQEFISESEYRKKIGEVPDIEEGTYYLLIQPDGRENFFHKFNDLDKITNSETGKQLSLRFAGTIECQQLIRRGPLRYVLSDSDYQAIKEGTTEKRLIKQVLFNVEDLESSDGFSKELFQLFLSRTTPEMAVYYLYDDYQKAIADENGEKYVYRANEVEMKVNNPELMEYWKYYPIMKNIITDTFFQNFVIFFLLFIFVIIICLAAVGIIAYTRSITIGINNRRLFGDLIKLGANDQYIRRIIVNQLNKIFMLPAIIGSALTISFLLITYNGNDGKITGMEWNSLRIELVVMLAVWLYLYLIYRFSFSKIKSMLKIS